MRIVAFVGSPVEQDEKEAVKVAKRLKKEKVNVDIVSFGEDVRMNFQFPVYTYKQSWKNNHFYSICNCYRVLTLQF